MKLSQSYVEMLNSGLNRPAEEGSRSFPTAAIEIMLLDHAQHRAQRREVAVFRQLCITFDWQLSQHQQNQYLTRLKRGYVLALTDSDQLIIWTSQHSRGMMGHRLAEVVGQKPLMFPESDTNPETMHWLPGQPDPAEAIRTELVNYQRDGTAHTCRVIIDPLRNSRGELTHFLAVENEID